MTAQAKGYSGAAPSLPQRGKFISFEGGEGTGKSTQVQHLAKALEKRDICSLITREPGGSPGAEVIRHVLLSGAAKPLGALTEAILFAAARDDHLREVIRPALARGEWVLCDRFSDSTRVYQGALGNVEPEMINALERITVGGTKPDLTLVLDIDPRIGLSRAAVRRGGDVTDRFEAENLDFHVRLRENYLQLAACEPKRCVVIDASGTEQEVADAIWRVIEERLLSHAKEGQSRGGGRKSRASTSKRKPKADRA